MGWAETTPFCFVCGHHKKTMCLLLYKKQASPDIRNCITQLSCRSFSEARPRTSWALLLLLREPELLKNMPEDSTVAQGPVTLKEPPQMQRTRPCGYVPSITSRQFQHWFCGQWLNEEYTLVPSLHSTTAIGHTQNHKSCHIIIVPRTEAAGLVGCNAAGIYNQLTED